VRGRLVPLLAVAVFAAAAVVVGGVGPAFAASPTLYVDNSAGANCSDGGGGTQSQPYCTIAAAVAVVVPGQIVNVLGTSYAEHVTVARSGTAGQPITIRAGAGPVALTGSGAGLTIAGQHDIVVDGLDVKPASSTVDIDVSNSAGITLRGFAATCYSTNPGVRLTAVTDSSVTGAQACGIVLDAATSGVQLKTIQVPLGNTGGVGIDVAGSNNSIAGMQFTGPRGGSAVSGTGIRLEPGAADNVLTNNVFDNQNIGIDNNGATGTAITNNSMTSICTGIRVAGASHHVSVQNNIVSDNGVLINSCPSSASSVNIGVYDDAVQDTTVDYNAVVRVDGLRQPYAWQTAMSLAQFQAASGQGAHDTQNAPTNWSLDSANSAAPGFPGTDAQGHAREDDPDVPNNGAGPITYADRGATELVNGPSVALVLSANQDAVSVTADATATRPGWVPIVSYTFNFGDGTPAVTQSSPVAGHQYAAQGTYTVSVVVTDAGGVNNGTFTTKSLWRAVRRIALLSDSDNRYVTADPAGSLPLIANRGAAGAWEQFDLVEPDVSHVALRSRINGKYIGVGGNLLLNAYQDTTDFNTLFLLLTNADGTVSLLSSGNQYVSAEAAGAQPLVANRSAIGRWEKFNTVDLANISMSLRSHANGAYVTAEAAGSKPLIANRSAIGSWEQFDLVDAGSGYVALYAHANGRFVTAESAGTKPLIASRSAIGNWERFTLIRNVDGSVSLLALADGRYVTAEAAGAKPLIANRPAIGNWEKFDLSR
jgi:hypothetical protein